MCRFFMSPVREGAAISGMPLAIEGRHEAMGSAAHRRGRGRVPADRRAVAPPSAATADNEPTLAAIFTPPARYLAHPVSLSAAVPVGKAA